MAFEEGCKCPECGDGVLECETPENCSCHISAPCNAHLDAPLVCSKCGEEFRDDPAPPSKPSKYVFDCYEHRHEVHSFFAGSAEIDFLYKRDTFGACGLFNFGTPYPDDFGDLFFSQRTNPFDLNWENLTHSTCSMLKRGWAPPWVSRKEAHEKLNGTFGGGFRYFNKNGQFEFVAYTD